MRTSACLFLSLVIMFISCEKEEPNSIPEEKLPEPNTVHRIHLKNGKLLSHYIHDFSTDTVISYNTFTYYNGYIKNLFYSKGAIQSNEVFTIENGVITSSIDTSYFPDYKEPPISYFTYNYENGKLSSVRRTYYPDSLFHHTNSVTVYDFSDNGNIEGWLWMDSNGSRSCDNYYSHSEETSKFDVRFPFFHVLNTPSTHLTRFYADWLGCPSSPSSGGNNTGEYYDYDINTDGYINRMIRYNVWDGGDTNYLETTLYTYWIEE